jgi:SH3 domain-containing YSC84-like protein 1
MTTYLRTILLFTLSLLITFPAMAVQKNRKLLNKAAERAEEASEVLNEIMGIRDRAIPKELLDGAEAVAVFPGVIKAAFIFGGRGGAGVISRRVRGGWSPPAFFKLGGGSFGAQVGADKSDFVLLFMNENALQGLLEDKFEIGGEGSIVAGPVGRTASASTNLTLDAGILSYSRGKGAFIGLALKGGMIYPDNQLNRAVYGKEARELLDQPVRAQVAPPATNSPTMPDFVTVFPKTLQAHSVR